MSFSMEGERMEIEGGVVGNLGDNNRNNGNLGAAVAADKEKSNQGGVLVGMLQMPSEEMSTFVQDTSTVKAQGGEEMTANLPAAEGAIVSGESQRWGAKVNGSESDVAKEEGPNTPSLKTMKVLDADRCRITSSIAAGVAAGVAEGIAESIAETIAKETAGHAAASLEGREGRFERLAIAKAVAEVIAESVAQEVALGMADGLAKEAAAAAAAATVKKREDPPTQGSTEGNKDGVLCDCALVAVVRVVGEKSPNRGLRYLMCSLQDPAFFKRKGKRKDSDTIGKCKFFRWLDTPRHTSKEDKKSHKTQQQPEEVTTPIPTRSAVKESNSGEALPSDDAGKLSGKAQRKKSLGEEEMLLLPGTLTRSALRRGGAPEPAAAAAQEPSSLETSPVSALGKRTSDWTDSYTGPESQKPQASFRKRRSVRGESGQSSRRSSAEKKPLHYFRRSTGQVISDPVTPQPVDRPEEPDNRFKSYYKKGRSLEPKSTSAPRAVVEEVKMKPQTRRQQRKLPLSEVYGAMEKQPTSKEIDASLSPPPVVPEPKEVRLSSSPPKKRKLSWVLSEDSVVQELDTPKRAPSRKGNSLSAERQTALFETPLVASAFPTVRYEAKLPAEECHDPDDPWSLEIPWAKQVHEKVEKEERCEDEAMEGEENEAVEGEEKEAMQGESKEAMQGENKEAMQGEEKEAMQGEEEEAMHGEEKEALQGEEIEATQGEENDAMQGEENEAIQDEEKEAMQGEEKEAMQGEEIEAMQGEEKEAMQGEENEAKVHEEERIEAEEVPIPGGISEPAGEEESYMQPTPDTVVDARTSLVDGPEAGEDLTQSHVDTDTVPDEITASEDELLLNPDSSVHSIVDPQPTLLEGVQHSEDFAEFPAPDEGSTPDVVVPEDHVVENAQELVLGGVNNSEAAPEEMSDEQPTQMS